uniref:Uncharacterized protein n=1 Tax=Tanacetum cinerariifolium TaxID=118510 RepID=A0A6L2M3A6_TANCI|nr:hypothetical protein [Tanacetum cinerariifolium]
MEALKDQKEMFDTLMDLRDDREAANTKLKGLNVLIAQAEEEIETKEAQIEAMNGVTLSQNQRLIAELEALGQWGDALMALEGLREMVARDVDKLRVLEQLLAATRVGILVKAGYAADIEDKE